MSLILNIEEAGLPVDAESGTVDYKSLSDDEWKKRLTDQQFYITRQKGTERAFTGYTSINIINIMIYNLITVLILC